ncbi:putative protein EIN4-like [Capsicum annuum]|nr:putative protein EIN4-like [Capsicum annuum]
MTSKRGVIPTKRISYPYTSQEIKAAKRRRKDISKALSSIKKVDVKVEATVEDYNIIVDNPSTVSKEEEKVEPVSIVNNIRKFHKMRNLINIIRGFSILTGLPWHLVDEVYIPINYGDEFQWMLAIVILKERCIRVYDSMSQRRRSEPSSEIQKLDKILSTYLDMSGFLDQKVRTDWSMIEAYRDKMEAKAQKPYTSDIKDPRRPKPNSAAPDEEQLSILSRSL